MGAPATITLNVNICPEGGLLKQFTTHKKDRSHLNVLKKKKKIDKISFCISFDPIGGHH